MRLFAAWETPGLLIAATLALGQVIGCGDADDAPAEAAAGAGASNSIGGANAGQVSWCQVSEVLQAKCQRCHIGANGMNGAPFPLVTYADTQVPEATGGLRWQAMQRMVENDFMPPDAPQLDPPAEKLSPDEKSLLLLWFDDGAKANGGAECGTEE